MNVKALLKDTAIYGLSSIIGRFLNYLLVPLYTYKIAAESGGYGIVTNLYAYSALLLALLTFGMETTFFRFSGKADKHPDKVYSSALIIVGSVSLIFLALVFAFLRPISTAMGYATHPEYIGCFALIAAMDAVQAIMFSRLRQQRRPFRFMALKLGFIVLNIGLNLFIFLLMPKIPALLPVFQRFDGGGPYIPCQSPLYFPDRPLFPARTAIPSFRNIPPACHSDATLLLSAASAQPGGHPQPGSGQDSLPIPYAWS